METILKCRQFCENGDYYEGFVVGQENFNKFLETVKSSGAWFVVRDSKNCQNDKGCPTIHFDETSGVPFFLGKKIYLECIHGKKYYNSKTTDNKQDHPTGKKSRFMIQDSKKIGCQSKMEVKVRHVFTEEKYRGLGQISTYQKKKISLELRNRLKTENKPTTEMHYLVKMMNNHSHPVTGQYINIHQDLVKRIQELVKFGITSVPSVKLHLRELVSEMFPDQNPPSSSNTAYFPMDHVIYNHINVTLLALKGSKSDQTALSNRIEQWKKDETQQFFFRPFKKSEADGVDDTSLLFCHQTLWQKEMMITFGNNVSLLDATYKTTKYTLPLFFIVVKTNVKYMVVGTFICQYETAKSISEGLQIFSKWNPEWKPKVFVTDYCEAEMTAINSVFQESKVFICAFHREQAWLRWVRKTGNIQYGSVDEVLKVLRSVLKVNNELELEETIQKLKESDIWIKNQKLQSYFSKIWLSVKERWIPCLQPRSYLNNITTNNGTEIQNRMLKSTYLKNCSDKSLTGLVNVLIEKFLPDCYLKFRQSQSCSLKQYNNEIPLFLHNRPPNFIKHIMSRYSSAKIEYSTSDLQIISESIVNVKSSVSSKYYSVNFDSVTCSCEDFKKWKQICKHFCACFLYLEKFSFDRLPAEYKLNPLHNMITETHEDEEMKWGGKFEVSLNEDNVGLAARQSSQIENLREITKQLLNLTYDLPPSNDYSNIIRQMTESKKLLEGYLAKSSDDIPLLQSNLKKRKILTEKNSVEEQENLPLPVKKKSKYAGRVGERAEVYKFASNLKIDFNE